MKPIYFIALISLNLFAGSAEGLKARYQITTPSQTSYVNYYRENKYVAYEYSSQGITEVWEKTNNNHAMLIQGFDKHKRSIEYEAIDLKMEKMNNTWQAHKSFIDPESIQYDLYEIKNENGKKIGHYLKHDKDKRIDIYWDNNDDLLLSFSIKDKQGYQLKYERISLERASHSHIKDVLAYESTDFADIGDNESDPFFRQMINLGFIRHHEANIIDSQGNQLSLAQEHHH